MNPWRTIPLIIAVLAASGVVVTGKMQKRRTNVSPIDVHLIADRVTLWQMENFDYSESGTGGHLHDYGIDAWTNATFYIGLFQWAETSAEGNRYFDWLLETGRKSGWKIPANFKGSRYDLYHADELCVGQFYLAMYGRYGDVNMAASTRERVDYVMANPPDPDLSIRSKQSWTWCDALFMAPLVYMALDNHFPGNGYDRIMDSQFRRTTEYLFDAGERLFFRDDSYFDHREENGEKVFWGRGNGWVVAGLANLLKIMPQNFPDRSYYEDLFQTVTQRLCELQSPDGSWHASLLDPESYPSPETSATALITHAVAYGIDKGLLETEKYAPVLYTAWQAIDRVVDPDGKPGCVQPIGADPKSVTREMTAVYGSGAILMAGSETAKLISKERKIRRMFEKGIK